MTRNNKRKSPKTKKYQTGGFIENIHSLTKIIAIIIALLELWEHIKPFF
jgi:hypothetical protein